MVGGERGRDDAVHVVNHVGGVIVIDVAAKDELVHLLLVHQLNRILREDVVLLLLRRCRCFLNSVEVDSLFTALLDMPRHQVVQLVSLLRVLSHLRSHLRHVRRVNLARRLPLLMKVDAHKFNGAYRGWICPWLMDHIGLLLEKLIADLLLIQWRWTTGGHRNVLIVIALHLTLKSSCLSFLQSDINFLQLSLIE